jgi:hypothetical protein
MQPCDARVDQLTDRLVDHFLEAAVLPQPMLKWEWLVSDIPDPTGVNKQFGWVPPFAIEGEHPDYCRCSACAAGDDVETIVAPFCPELIAEQTADLDDAAFEQYVDVIDFCSSLHIIHRHRPADERQRLVDNALYDQAPGSMELQNAVQMRVLDRMQDAA